MKDNKRFNIILDECLERIVKGESVEQCLARYPDQAKELEPLLQTACVTRQLSTIQPRLEFKERARFQFRTMMAEKFREPERSKSHHWYYIWRSAWAIALTSFIVVVLLAGSTVAAAGNSMPDQPLYLVKLAVEEVRVKLTASQLSKAELIAEMADKRVAEIVYLAGKAEPEKLEVATERLNDNLAKIAQLAQSKQKDVTTAASRQADLAQEQSPAAFGAAKPAPAVTISPTVEPSRAASPSPSAKPAPSKTPASAPADSAAKPAPKPAPKTAQAPKAATAAPVPSDKAETVPDASVASAESVQREKLKEVINRYAVNHPAKLIEALKKAPAEVRPALRKALEESLAGYQQAIESIEAEAE